MATPAENLARSLEALKQLQEAGKVAIRSADLSRTNRERLLQNGFLQEVTKGWYIAKPANEQPGDSTSWYASFWAFCAGYLDERYGNNYFISPDQSLLLHAGNRSVPLQLMIRTTAKTNHNTPLPFHTSLWHGQAPVPEAASFMKLQGLRMMDVASSLVYCTPGLFTLKQAEVRTALAMVPDATELNRILLQGGHSAIAGRLAGAFRSLGKQRMANDILKTMQSVGYAVRETNPFETLAPAPFLVTERSPHVNRIRLLWQEMRQPVLQVFPPAPALPVQKETYLQQVDALYTTDAYHSLSIERYQVTPELIERVRSGNWDVHNNATDRQQRDAMAARGYWQASQRVKQSIARILDGENAGTVADADYGDWYRELFAPSVQAGLIPAADLAGFRNKQVFISGSRHVPPGNEAVREIMPVLMELLQQERDAGVRAVLGHFLFGYIHPYIDGNGRMARFLMNVMLASGGYPWTVIPVQHRSTYMQALEQASVERNIEPFAQFLAWLVGESLKGEAVARV
ncbi:MAG TPA: Fic family protein [Lacibacter sp.]|nr:Fic family protein [Lacibacter sp.]HMO88330.1 Fic family protein [Lacibacter sp.]